MKVRESQRLFVINVLVASYVRAISSRVQSVDTPRNCCIKEVHLVCECVPVTAIFISPSSLSVIDAQECM